MPTVQGTPKIRRARRGDDNYGRHSSSDDGSPLAMWKWGARRSSEVSCARWEFAKAAKNSPEIRR